MCNKVLAISVSGQPWTCTCGQW